MYKRVLIALAAVALIVGGVTYVAHAATRNVSCPGTVTDTTTTYTVNVQCSFPKPAPVTVTATVTQTAAPSPTPTPTPTVTPTPSQTPTPTPTPTPSPTATPTVPPPPPTGFPDGSNTGVPAGTVLTTYTGPCTITTAGLVIDAKTVNCNSGGVTIAAANVTIRNSKVNGRIEIDTDTNNTWSVTITDSEVNADAFPAESSIGNGNMTVTRTNIHGGHNGIQCEEHAKHCILRDSWIHGQILPAGSADHLGGFADFGHVVTCDGPNFTGVPVCVELTHNTVACDHPPNNSDGGCSGDLNMFSQLGPLHGAYVVNNLFKAMAGGAYCTYGGYSNSDHVVYMNNVFEKGPTGKCMDYGPVTSFDGSRPGNVWSNNTWTDGGTVPPEN